MKMMLFPTKLIVLGIVLTVIDLSYGKKISSKRKESLTINLIDNESTVVDVPKGDNMKIICVRPDEWFSDAKTVWNKDGALMDPEDYPTIIFSSLNLQLVKIQYTDSGVYECNIRNPLENYEIRRNVTINVIRRSEAAEFDEEDYEDELLLETTTNDENTSCDNYKSYMDPNNTTPFICFDLRIRRRPMTHYIVKTAGVTVSIFCNVKGYPKAEINWLKEGRPFQTMGYQHTIKKNALGITEVTPKDEGDYTCEATNGNGTKIQYKIRFDVVHRVQAVPIFTIAPTNETVVLGDTVRLEVKILSDSEYDLSWIKHSIDDPNKYEPIQSRTDDKKLQTNKHVLILENVTFSDQSWYSCVAANTFGKQMKSAFVEILEAVPPMEVLEKAYSSTYLVVFLTVGTFVVCVIGIIMFRCMRCKPWRPDFPPDKPPNFTKKVVVNKKPAEENERTFLIPEINIKYAESNKSGQEYELPIDLAWEFSREKLALGKFLGAGAFGEVHLGSADGIFEKGVISTVAVKYLKATHTDAEMIDLISEMETMKELGRHPNIINLLGCCTQNGELLVIMEFAEHGNLKDYLRDRRHHFLYEKPKKCASTIIPIDVSAKNELADEDTLTFRDLMSFAFQVARGMDYLVDHKYIHRDLAARNILVSIGKIAKIADFGMTRSTFVSDYYRKKSDGRVPLRWMAPETLFHRVYTTQSDVWSYGILLWEIVTLGGMPYPCLQDTSKILDLLSSGRRMDQPSNCPTELYLIMRDCWMETPKARPSFSDLVEDIRRILYIASGTEYMELEGVRPLEDIPTPPSSPENSGGEIMFDPDFIKSFCQP